MIEIERKFLVDVNKFIEHLADNGCHGFVKIDQGYLVRNDNVTLRVRTYGDWKSVITIKTKRTELSSYELEVPIPHEDALELFTSSYGKVNKTRYMIPHGNHVWEVDVFHGLNDGLVVAEIELSAEDECFDRPSWVLDEVTDQGKYKNARLAMDPYSTWSKK